MKFFDRRGATATVAQVKEGTADYNRIYRDVFNTAPDQRPGWLHFPFPWGSPEATELQSTIWRIESQLWKQFLEKVRVEKVRGDLVEFGVSVGNSLEELISYCDQVALKISIYGFDSFEGLPEPSISDPDYWKKGEFAACYDSVSERLKTNLRPHVKLVKGWFSESLSDPDIQRSIREVAFARIDCDLYQSAVECLGFLEGRLSHGSYLCFDDWTDNPATGETRAFIEFARRTKRKYVFKPICRVSVGGMHMRVYHV